MDIQIKLDIPDGQIINGYSSIELTEELNGEIQFFLKSTEYPKKVSKSTKTPKNAQGAYELVTWIIENFEEHKKLIEAIEPFLKHLSLWAFSKLFSKKKEPNEPKVIIIIDGKEISLPQEKDKLNDFIDKQKKN